MSTPSATDYDFSRCKLCGKPAKPFAEIPGGQLYACGACDLHYLDHIDGEEAGADAPLSDKARRYIELRSDESALLHPSRAELVRRTAGDPPCRLLDIGAGIGQFQLLMNEEGYSTNGIEPSALRRGYAAETFNLQLSDQPVDAHFWQDNFAAAFDLITLWDVIEHVNFPRQLLRAAVNLLKPGGLLLLDTPNRDGLSYRLSCSAARLSGGKLSLFLGNFYSAAPFGHKQIFTPAQLDSLFTDLGLEVIHRAASYGRNPHKGDKIILCGRKK
ncbi:MAG: hypothetical protein C0622_13360 [Desulfuromonas sp.]|nr:MAG: hypothetical protein C0622_13360 [Desulfuromonas sp.]